MAALGALADKRARSVKQAKHDDFTLVSGQVAYQGGPAFQDPTTSKLKATPANGLIFIGFFNESMDASSADKTVSVDLIKEKVMEWFANGTTAAVAATDTGKLCYFEDNQSVQMNPVGSGVIAGIVRAVDATDGVLVELSVPSPDLLATPTIAAYTANDLAPASVAHDAVYDVPTTGAASTITLPAAAPNGTRCYFAADGTKNGHTVTYRDATGPTALTTALTASKRHLVVAVKQNDKWFANAYVSP